MKIYKKYNANSIHIYQKIVYGKLKVVRKKRVMGIINKLEEYL